MVWRTFWIGASVVGALLAVLVWAATTQVTFLFHHPRTAGVRVEIDKRTGGAVVVTPVSAKSATGDPAQSTAKPCLQAAETVFDFGTMNPHSTQRHDFTIRNVGTAPLKLRVGTTTCKCTISGVQKNEVAPGESTIVALQWTTEDLTPFAQTATIHSNDPSRKSIDFVVQGKVRMVAGFDEPQMRLDRVDPNQPTSAERLVYSEVWDTLSIVDVQSQLGGLEWEVLPVDPKELPDLAAKSAACLRLTIPANAIERRHQETLRLTIQSGEETQHLELPLIATALRPLTFYGPVIDSDGVVDLGDIAEGRGMRAKLLVKVRDSEIELANARLDVFPEFLDAALKPHANQAGLYDLTIEVPVDVPPCQFRSTPIGRLKIATGYEPIGDVELKVSFAVVPRKSL